jgi:hypothetical protein
MRTKVELAAVTTLGMEGMLKAQLTAERNELRGKYYMPGS